MVAHKMVYLTAYLRKIYVLKKLVEDETTKKINKDSAEWTLLMDSIVIKITNSAGKHLSLIEEKNHDYIEQLETNEEYTKNLRIALAEKNVVSETF